MFYSNNFILKFVLLVIILNHFIGLSDAKPSLKTRQNPIGMTVHAKAGHYPWADKDNKCGLVTDSLAKPRIVNGTEVDIQQIPWMASMVVTFYPKEGDYPRPIAGCGGVIISDYFLLTSAWCVLPWKDVMYFHAYVGSKYKYESYKVKYEVQEKNTVLYEPLVKGYPAIALVRVKHRIPSVFYNNRYRINRVCLPEQNIINNKTEDALLSGFGMTDMYGSEQSWTLRKSTFKIDSVDDCQRTMNFNKDYICSSFTDQQTCQGDMGSPLVQFDRDRAVLIGIAVDWFSLKFNNETLCGPGETLFVRVSQFIGWIKNIIERDDGLDYTTPAPYTRPPAQPPVTRPTKKPEQGEGDGGGGSVDPSENKGDSGHSSPLLVDKTVSLVIAMFCLLMF